MDQETRWQTNPIRELFDATLQHYAIRFTCRRCRNKAVFHAAGLWHMFEKKGWNGSLRDTPRRLRCTKCGDRRPRLELVTNEAITAHLELPTDLEWKQATRRRR